MSTYLFAAGGSGARVAEALTYLAAMGLMGQDMIHVVLCDKDAQMGDTTKAANAVERYQSIHNALEHRDQADFFRTPLQLHRWPFECQDNPGANYTLNDLIGTAADAQRVA